VFGCDIVYFDALACVVCRARVHLMWKPVACVHTLFTGILQ